MKALATVFLLLALAAPPLLGAAPLLAAPPPLELGPGAEEIAEWRARWELARLLGYAKRYSESLNEYRRLLREKPDLTAAKIEMAQVYYWNGQRGEALEILRGVPQDQLDPEAKLALIDLLMAQKQYTQAEKLLREHLAQSPDDLKSRLKLAELLSWDKRYEASLAEYRRILEARPDDMQVRRKYGFVLGWAGQREQAIAELKKSLGDGVAPSKP